MNELKEVVNKFRQPKKNIRDCCWWEVASMEGSAGCWSSSLSSPSSLSSWNWSLAVGETEAGWEAGMVSRESSCEEAEGKSFGVCESFRFFARRVRRAAVRRCSKSSGRGSERMAREETREAAMCRQKSNQHAELEIIPVRN
jgi:hypothetical protein